jgi:hypothetical protein
VCDDQMVADDTVKIFAKFMNDFSCSIVKINGYVASLRCNMCSCALHVCDPISDSVFFDFSSSGSNIIAL